MSKNRSSHRDQQRPEEDGEISGVHGKRKAENVPAGAGRVEYLEDSQKGATCGSESVKH